MLKRLGRVVRSVFGQVRPLDTRLEEEKRRDPEVAAFERELAKKQAKGETVEAPAPQPPAEAPAPPSDADVSAKHTGKTLG